MSEPKRLYRSVSDRRWAGVCGGLAEYFNIDSSLVRLLFVVFSLSGGPGLVAYVVLWVLMPENPGDDVEYVKVKKRKNDEAYEA